MKRKIVVANWKMHPPSFREAKKIFTAVTRSVSRMKKTQVVVCPSALYLSGLKSSYRGSKVLFGSQDVSHLEEKTGSYTGETSAYQFAGSGVTHTIIGHSERRALGETDTRISQKVSSACAARLSPILCVGERARDDQGDYLVFLRKELQLGLAGVTEKDTRKLIIAYEPLWAIGKSADNAVTPDALRQTVLFIRKTLVDLFGRKHGVRIPILYGGAVEPANAGTLAAVEGVAGFLVGHASLVPKDFTSIVRAIDRS